MLSWLADTLQIIFASDNTWKGIALLALAYFGYQIFEEIKKVHIKFSTIAGSLLNEDGEAVSFSKALAMFTMAQSKCSLNQAECMALQAEFREEPWRFCEKFADCPAVQTKITLVAHVEAAIKDHLKDDLSYKEEANKHIIAAFETAAQDRKRIEDMILKNREIFTTFTQELGREVIRAIGKGLVHSQGAEHDN